MRYLGWVLQHGGGGRGDIFCLWKKGVNTFLPSEYSRYWRSSKSSKMPFWSSLYKSKSKLILFIDIFSFPRKYNFFIFVFVIVVCSEIVCCFRLKIGENSQYVSCLVLNTTSASFSCRDENIPKICRLSGSTLVNIVRIVSSSNVFFFNQCQLSWITKGYICYQLHNTQKIKYYYY